MTVRRIIEKNAEDFTWSDPDVYALVQKKLELRERRMIIELQDLAQRGIAQLSDEKLSAASLRDIMGMIKLSIDNYRRLQGKDSMSDALRLDIVIHQANESRKKKHKAPRYVESTVSTVHIEDADVIEGVVECPDTSGIIDMKTGKRSDIKHSE